MADQFYDIKNVVSIDIEMKDWDELRNAEPAFGWRGDRKDPNSQQSKDELAKLDTKRQKLYNDWKHYAWYQTTKVSVSGTVYPTKSEDFTGVCIVKKSFWGSKRNDKPSLKLDFDRVLKENTAADANAKASDNARRIRILTGTTDLTLNNCAQDSSYIRQPLGYAIFGQLGVPTARCNFVKVKVNGADLGVYVNLEQMREPYLQRNFGNDKGNLYEVEWKFDLTSDHLLPLDRTQKFPPGFDLAGFSPFKDQKDLRLAIQLFEECLKTPAQQLQKWKTVVDVDRLIQALAAQGVVNHWDGYPNNSSIYNLKDGVAEPTADNIKLTLIPSGIDRIFENDSGTPHGRVKVEGVLGSLVRNDNDARAKLLAAIKNCTTTYSANLAKNKQFVDSMSSLLNKAGVANYQGSVLSAINEVKDVMDKAPACMANPIFWPPQS